MSKSTELASLNSQLAMLELKKASAIKSYENLEAQSGYDGEEVTVWCADLSEDLSGVVGTIEVPGEKVDINIQPGFGGNSLYEKDRDGQLVKTALMTPEQAYFNLAMLPGWQKWKPTFRYGAITALNGDVCSITLEGATSSQQGLNVNQASTLSNIPISYMDCDGKAFEVGDNVLVKFNGQNFTAPQVVGFKEEPKPCGGKMLVFQVFDTGYGIDEYMVYDLDADMVADNIPKDDSGTPVSFPCPPADLVYWFGKTAVKDYGWSLAGGHRKTEKLSRISPPFNGTEHISEVIPCAGESYVNTRTGTYTYPDISNRTWETQYEYNLNNAMCFSNTYIMTSRKGEDTGDYSASDDYATTGVCDLYALATLDRNYKFFTPATEVNLFDEYSVILQQVNWSKETGSWVLTQIACEREADRMRVPTPHMYATNMQTDEFYIMIGYTSFGWFLEELTGGCSSYCGGGGGGMAYSTTDQPWKDAIIVDTDYLAGGLDPNFDPAQARGTMVGTMIKDHLTEVYSRYRTNGFPLTDWDGPAWRLNHSITTRE